jgi:YVTN family beta-propeller protein
MRVVCCLFILLLFLSCKKDPSSAVEDLPPQKVLHGVFILNEGNFGKINASISYFDPRTDEMYNRVYKTANDRDLGSIAQSMVFLDSLALIVLNGSDKIEVINAGTFKTIRTIDLPAGSSPRYISLLGKEKAYITNLYTNTCSVIDLRNWHIIKHISVGANPEGVAIADGKVYVANSGFGSGNTVSVIATDVDNVIHTIVVADNPISVQAVKDRVYVLCSGSYGSDFISPDDDTPGAIFCIDSRSNTVVDSVLIEGHPSKLALSENNRGFFIGSSGIMCFNTETLIIEAEALITGFYYGLGCDLVSKNIYLLDAKDFMQQGQLIIHDDQGSKLSEKAAGIIPGTVGFYYEEK